MDNDFELRPLSHIERNEEAPPRQFSLPSVDGGKDAWLCLLGCFMIEIFVWGFPSSFGVLQDYYSTHAPFSDDPSSIAAIGTTQLGVIYLSGPLAFGILGYWPQFRRTSCYVGLVLLVLALVASSFANTVWQLLLTQGLLYAIGGSFLYSPSVMFVDDWFVHRKGLAYGIMWAGTGAAGTAFPYIFTWALDRYSLRTALRMWAVVTIVLLLPCLYFTRPRIDASQSAPTSARRLNLSFLKSRRFLIYNLCNTIQGLGYFIPSIWLPIYARSIGVTSSPLVTATVALLNLSAVLGCVCIGLAVDRFHTTTAILISTVGALSSVFIFWGLSSSITMLLIFSFAYGFFAGSFSTTWSGIIKETIAVVPETDPSLAFGFLAMGRGIGSVCAGPISDALVHGGHALTHDNFSGYAGDYSYLILITGITAGLGGCSWGARRVGWV